MGIRERILPYLPLLMTILMIALNIAKLYSKLPYGADWVRC